MADTATSQDAVDTAQAAMRSADAQVKSTQAEINRAQSTLKADQANLGYTQDLRADGRHRVVDPGETGPDAERQSAGADHPAHRRPLDHDGLDAGVGSRRAELELGMDAYFTTLGRPTGAGPGKLRQILPTPDGGEQRRALHGAVRRGRTRARI